MSEKLDQSLDQILASRRAAGGRGARGRGRAGTRAPSTRNAAPTGGVQKKTQAVTKPTANKAKPNGAAVRPTTAGVDTKIIVSNLPRDVDEAQIQEYFKQSVGPVKKVFLEYDRNGTSKGRASIIFGKPGGANKALEVNNGVMVEGRPMKIEIVIDATRATQGLQKSLSDRISAPKSAAAQPKSAASKKDRATPKAVNGTAERGAKTAGAARGGRGAAKRAAGRPKPKTAEELDAEMTDYFVAGTEDGANGAAAAAPAAADADTGMDEVS